jgi:hypothetical protein
MARGCMAAALRLFRWTSLPFSSKLGVTVIVHTRPSANLEVKMRQSYGIQHEPMNPHPLKDNYMTPTCHCQLEVITQEDDGRS